MRQRTKRLLLSGLALAILSVAGFVAYVDLKFEGWPEHHLYEPAFAKNVPDKNWNGFSGETRLNAELTRALRNAVGDAPRTASLVEALDEQGFLAVEETEELDGVCPSDQSGFERWLRGCRSRPSDLAVLKSAPAGTMWYYWSGFACNYTITVTWRSASGGRANAISAKYSVVCL